ncbi:uncharacterized protein Z520_01774 [Fonsecaea multimorphosa CBS 102226]|uniref:Shikimate dehydrogenase substrate binding N-terminal domain-containing protein n=1 Tax=Fonsecaea multimorphosa CBS 102226 TaxID=1442371 RepID=A0A0D2J1Q3_9EURO|nr:uncharacterized protein Z520_01774 [Fonsecaea multimorphosa CBS 102226]KIY03307.1 hypothetical protein Z520_01774 [Fonsecaea multimorphosa CBS 102226]OAL30224.1 hypothetical protein AYO22_01740 [Fonsecaea multimorphosa]
MGNDSTARTQLFIAGAPGGGSIAPPAHDFIAHCLERDWKMTFLAASTLQVVSDAFHAPDFAGGVVTMPYKKTIIPCLDHVDDLVDQLGACNHVSVADDGTLRGTNTDWVGIKKVLLQGAPTTDPGQGPRGMVVGAGGASRAAIYALMELGCKDVYIINRDAGEVEGLVEDVHHYKTPNRPNIVHVQTLQQAQTLLCPHWIVSTVPDFEPRTLAELEARSVYIEFLTKERPHQALMLDMCYHPLMTRNLQLAKQHGWQIVDGVQVVGHQLKEQWRLWTGEEINEQQEEVAWRILRESASSDSTVIHSSA